MGNNGLDANEIDSNAEEDEPLELHDAVEKQYDASSSEDADDIAHFAILCCIRFSRRSTHPHILASLSVRKKVSIASTSRRISSNEGRHPGIGENI